MSEKVSQPAWRRAIVSATWQCGARTGNIGAGDPQDCDWPVCGCDPAADRVIAALQESGMPLLTPQAKRRIGKLIKDDIERQRGTLASIGHVMGEDDKADMINDIGYLQAIYDQEFAA